METSAVKAELLAFHSFIDDPGHSGQSFQFHSLGNIAVTDVERLDVNVAGVHVNVAPVVAQHSVHAGGTPSHVVTGGAGADGFFWNAADVGPGHSLDHIANFSFEQFDRLDVTRLTANHHPAAIGDVAQTVDTAQGTLVQVRVNGAAAWTDVVVLDNVHHVSATELWQSHSLIL